MEGINLKSKTEHSLESTALSFSSVSFYLPEKADLKSTNTYDQTGGKKKTLHWHMWTKQHGDLKIKYVV